MSFLWSKCYMYRSILILHTYLQCTVYWLWVGYSYFIKPWQKLMYTCKVILSPYVNFTFLKLQNICPFYITQTQLLFSLKIVYLFFNVLAKEDRIYSRTSKDVGGGIWTWFEEGKDLVEWSPGIGREIKFNRSSS